MKPFLMAICLGIVVIIGMIWFSTMNSIPITPIAFSSDVTIAFSDRNIDLNQGFLEIGRQWNRSFELQRLASRNIILQKQQATAWAHIGNLLSDGNCALTFMFDHYLVEPSIDRIVDVAVVGPILAVLKQSSVSSDTNNFYIELNFDPWEIEAPDVVTILLIDADGNANHCEFEAQNDGSYYPRWTLQVPHSAERGHLIIDVVATMHKNFHECIMPLDRAANAISPEFRIKTDGPTLSHDNRSGSFLVNWNCNLPRMDRDWLETYMRLGKPYRQLNSEDQMRYDATMRRAHTFTMIECEARLPNGDPASSSSFTSEEFKLDELRATVQLPPDIPLVGCSVRLVLADKLLFHQSICLIMK